MATANTVYSDPRKLMGATVATPTLTVALLVVYGIGLNQANVILGVNISVSDIIAVVILVVLALQRKLWVPTLPALFFLTLSLLTLAVSLFISPTWLESPLPAMAIARDYTKLVASFASFILGIAVVRIGGLKVVFRAFYLSAAFISLLGIMGMVTGSSGALGGLYFGGFRYQGLTNDPNYFAVMSVAALAMLLRDREVPRPWSYILTGFLVLGVVLSASKTGLITLAIFAIWHTFATSKQANSFSEVLRRLFVLFGLLLVVAFFTSPGSSALISNLTAKSPALSRVAPLIQDFGEATSTGGSSRGGAWSNALEVTGLSPILGVGMGGYLPVSEATTGAAVLAHNTYLQIAAEWGVPLAVVFFAWLLVKLATKPRTSDHKDFWATASEGTLVILIGSLGLSLNNTRLLWVLVGVIAGCHLLKSNKSSQAQVNDSLGTLPPSRRFIAAPEGRAHSSKSACS